MGDDESKRLILARRARFVAAALAGVAATANACGGDAEPQPCLSPLYDGGISDGRADAADARPQPCLEPMIEDAAKPDADADAEPQPCLSPLPPDADQ
jgi:hypothetical protein